MRHTGLQPLRALQADTEDIKRARKRRYETAKGLPRVLPRQPFPATGTHPPRPKEGVRGQVPGGFQRQRLWPPEALFRAGQSSQENGDPVPRAARLFRPATRVRREFLPDARAHASEEARITPF